MAQLPQGWARVDESAASKSGVQKTDVDEPAFRRWYADVSKRYDLNPDPEGQFYDYRAAFKAGAKPDATGHWPSQFKQEGHPAMVVGGFHVQTGERVPGTKRANRKELIELGWDPAAAARLSVLPDKPSTPSLPKGWTAAPEPAAPRPGAPGLVGAFVEQVNPLTAAQGLVMAASHPVATVQTLGQRQGQLGEDAIGAFKAGNYPRAARKTLHWLLPVIGPALDEQSERFERGDVAAGLGGSLGIGASLVGPSVVPKVAAKLETAVSNWKATQATKASGQSIDAFLKAAPPTKAAPYTPADLKTAAPYLDGLSPNQIATVEAARDAADLAIGNIEGNIAAAVQQHAGARLNLKIADAAAAKLGSNPRGGFIDDGLAAVYKQYPQLAPRTVNGLTVTPKITLADADRIRRALNADMQAILKRNMYDRATAFEADPVFAAQSVVAEQLRDAVYGGLASRGIPGMRALRQTEGSIIKVRNALERQIFNGEKAVAGTRPGGVPGTVRQVAALGVRATPGLPAIVADPLAKVIAPQNLTRDALIARAFDLRRRAAPVAPVPSHAVAPVAQSARQPVAQRP